EAVIRLIVVKSGERSGNLIDHPRSRRGAQATAADIESLRLFRGKADGHLLAKILHDASAILALPTESRVVLRIDGHGQIFAAIVEQRLGFGCQAPHLSPGKDPSTGCLYLGEDLPLTVRVAVALVVIGSGSRREPVH